MLRFRSDEIESHPINFHRGRTIRHGHLVRHQCPDLRKDGIVISFGSQLENTNFCADPGIMPVTMPNWTVSEQASPKSFLYTLCCFSHLSNDASTFLNSFTLGRCVKGPTRRMARTQDSASPVHAWHNKSYISSCKLNENFPFSKHGKGWDPRSLLPGTLAPRAYLWLYNRLGSRFPSRARAGSVQTVWSRHDKNAKKVKV